MPNIRRLAMTADLADNLAPDTFNAGTWAGECGTIACLVGHAAQDPAHQFEGLQLVKLGGLLAPMYDGKHGWSAISAFYEVSDSDARWLFDWRRYRVGVQPEAVASRVHAFVAEQSSELVPA